MSKLLKGQLLALQLGEASASTSYMVSMPLIIIFKKKLSFFTYVNLK